MAKIQPRRTDTLKSSFQEPDEGSKEEGVERGKRSRMRRPPTQGSRRTKSTASSQDDLTKHESTLVESEANPRDILETREKELQKQLEEVEERCKNLSKDLKDVQSLYEAEQEDCEDIISVAKRNVERTVDQILENQDRKRELESKISNSQDAINSETRMKRNRQAMEEESRIRNIVVIQTKILVFEAKRSKRDQILTKIKEAEAELLSMDERHKRELQEFKAEMIEKYETICYDLQDHVKSVSENVRLLSQSQQVVALKQRHQYILETQARYKRASALLLELYDQNKYLRKTVHSLKEDLKISGDLAQALTKEAEKAKKKISYISKEKSQEKTKDGNEEEAKENKEEETKNKNEEILPKESLSLKELTTQIKDLESRCFRLMDYKKELEEILQDQKEYKSVLDKREMKQLYNEEKLSSMTKAAESFLVKQDKDTTTSTLSHSEFLQNMSNLLKEVVDSSEVPEPSLSSDRVIYEMGCLGLVPKQSIIKKNPRKLSLNPPPRKLESKLSSSILPDPTEFPS